MNDPKSFCFPGTRSPDGKVKSYVHDEIWSEWPKELELYGKRCTLKEVRKGIHNDNDEFGVYVL